MNWDLTFGKRQDTVFLGRDISQERNYSEAIAYAIDKEARAVMDELIIAPGRF